MRTARRAALQFESKLLNSLEERHSLHSKLSGFEAATSQPTDLDKRHLTILRISKHFQEAAFRIGPGSLTWRAFRQHVGGGHALGLSCLQRCRRRISDLHWSDEYTFA